ncbi:ATP-binding protein [Bacillus sp. JJ1562]|uniref:ATP-binding protein n=1 Tax=Bacillus sp. JJ1562 TaxID=3122960 RepID=UPI003002AA98
MKLNKYLKTSLVKQFITLTITIIIAFSLLITAFMLYQNRITVHYELMNDHVEEKNKHASDLRYSINLAISEMRAYYAYGGEQSYFKNFQHQKGIVEGKIAALQDDADGDEDILLLQETKDFYNYYFHDVQPRTKDFYDNGQFDEVTKIAINQNASDMIRVYQNSLKEYTDDLHEQLTIIHDELTKKIFVSQVIFVILLMVLNASTVIFALNMLRRLRRPLEKVTIAAGEIADGKTVSYTDTTNRDDELGLLSKAFEKMSKSIQDKEQDLSAQNEELLAQQDELQAQHLELEKALETMQSRELELKTRNDLINGIANSLDKKEVLTSIVKTMCSIIGADKGIIVLLDRKYEHASYGVSEQGVEQFINHMHSGLMIRLKETKKPFTIKRESNIAEKGYHTSNSYSFDLYLPVLSSSGNIEAVMIFTRFDKIYDNAEFAEYDNLSKQIAISLDKIKLFEHSEEERLLTQDILDNIKEGIQLVDVSGKVIQVNKKLCDMLECDSSTFIQKDYENWMTDLVNSVENGLELKRFLHSILFENNTEQTSFIYHQHSPVYRVVRVDCEPLTRSGEKFGTVIVHRDITKEYEVDVMKSEFVSTVSHELRTPLASVLGFTELMLNKELAPDRQKKYLTTIFQEAKRLTLLINDFLDVQRMEAGKQTYHQKFDDIIPLLRNVIETFELNNPNHFFRFEVKTDHTMVLGDKDKLSQVFTNLISNAIKYSPNGGNIYVTVYEEGTNLKIAIKDEGLGIPTDALDKLFTKFFRVDNSDRRKIGGTGLGLVIVKEIMKAHNGDISVQSVMEKGSTFTVSFPLVIGMQDNTQSNENEQNDGRKVNVIIVEDDNSLANLLRTELEESNFRVKVFNEGESAIKAIMKEQPDAVVLDIMLEERGMNGWDMIRQMKDIDKLKSIPIFISSALDEKEKGLALGANEYLIKPYQPSILSKLILQTLLKKDWSGQILIPSDNKE